MDLYVLRGTWDAFTMAAETTSIASGSNGHPGKVVVLHLGKEFYGFEMSDDYIGQGIRPFGNTASNSSLPSGPIRSQ